MRSPRSSRDIVGLGYISTKEGESSKTTKERNIKGKNSKPTWHYCGKKGHIANVCMSKSANQNAKSKFMTHYQKCNKKWH